MKEIFKINRIDLYLLLWTVFHIMTYLRISGAGVFLIAINVWSLYDMIMLHSENVRSRYVKIYDVFTAMLVIYGLYFWLFGNHYPGVENRSFIIKVWGALFPFYTFYRASLKLRFNKYKILLWIIPFFVIALLDYQLQLQIKLENYLDGDREVVNNGSYAILGLLPLVGFLKKRYLQIAVLLFCFYFIVTSFKRGPILIFSCCLFYYFFQSLKYNRNKTWIILLGIVSYVVIFHFVSDLLANSDVFQIKLERTLAGDSSERDIIRQNLLMRFADSNIYNLLFGYGAWGTLKLCGQFAHSDWLEVLINQGFVGIVIHSFFCWNIFNVWNNTDKTNPHYLAIAFFAIIYLLTTIFSMAYDCVPIYEMAVFAYFVAILDKKEMFLKIKK